MLIARLAVDTTDPNLARGFEVPRGTALMSTAPRGQDTCCEFRSAHAVTLWPIEVTDVRYFAYAPDLPLARLSKPQGTKAIRGGLRIRLRAGGGQTFAQLGLDRLVFHISAPDEIAYRLHELVLGATMGTLVHPARDADKLDPSLLWRSAESVQPIGFATEEALLPDSLRAFSGYRLLQEVAAMPQRLLFFEVGELRARLAQLPGDEVELVLLFERSDDALEAVVDAQSLALFCTPAINLFRKRLDRIQLGPGMWEYHVVPDRTRPMDFEVHSLETVTGFGTGKVGQQHFEPLYATFHAGSKHTQGEAHGFYTVRREPRLMSQREQHQGRRSSYIGEEVYLSLVDPQHVPYREDIRQLSVSAWVSNRDLPTLLPGRAADDAGTAWRLDGPGPVIRVDALRGPTRPVTRRPVGELGWSLVSHLTLNHLSLIGESP
jgi:type VI secretion system protein ImpG